MRRFIRDKAIRFAVLMERIQDQLIWNASNLKQLMFHANLPVNKKANFLVISDERYVKALEVAVNSFLSHHYEFNAIIHTDQKLLEKIKEIVRSSPYFRKIEIRLIGKPEDWRTEKLRIIDEMLGTQDYYLDVDTRTNGRFPFTEEIIFFVDEGLLIKITEADFSETSYNMLNTTFFSWSGITMNKPTGILEIFQTLEKKYKNSEKERLLEQMALSIFIQKNHYEYKVLKSNDKSFDGGILESSYLGTTGRQIYRR